MRRFRKTVSVGAEVTSGGRLFQRRLTATGNARSPTVDSRVRRITSCEDDDDRRRRRLESWSIVVVIIIIIIILAHQHKAAGMKIKVSKNKNNDHDGV